MKAEGTQILAEYFLCNTPVLSDVKAMEVILRKNLKSSGFTVEDIITKAFEPIGLTSIAILSESHLALHSYPESGHASVDLFHCSTDLEPSMKLVEGLCQDLEATHSKLFQMQRGPRIAVLDNNVVTSEARPGFSVQYLIKEKIYESRSEHQNILIIENDAFGRMMFLDGEPQLAEFDVHLYNRALVDPLSLMEDLSRVVILGGGDGGVLREVLKFDIEEVFVVDFDAAVVEAANKYLVRGSNQFEDPRTKIVIDDAASFLEKTENLDAVIYDLNLHPTSITTNTAREYLSNLMVRANKALRPGGLWSMQCCADHDLEKRNVLQEVLPHSLTNVCFEKVFIPSLCGPWTFAFGFNKYEIGKN